MMPVSQNIAKKRKQSSGKQCSSSIAALCAGYFGAYSFSTWCSFLSTMPPIKLTTPHRVLGGSQTSSDTCYCYGSALLARSFSSSLCLLTPSCTCRVTAPSTAVTRSPPQQCWLPLHCLRIGLHTSDCPLRVEGQHSHSGRAL